MPNSGNIRRAYPNYSDYMAAQQIYDINKWLAAMKGIYVKLNLGTSKNAATDQITKEWDPVEKREFLNWLKYYESGDYIKYKKAQHSYYVNDDINYFLPNPKAPIPSPIRSMNDQVSSIPQEAAEIATQRQNELSKEDKRKIIEDQRRKILGRLNSAEKLLSSHQGQVFAGPDFERLLIAIYELKKQIQTVNKISLSTQTVIDLIVRQANILKMQGFNNASGFLAKFAQNTPGDFSMNLGEVPAGGSQPQGGGSLGNITPDLLQTPGGPESKEITSDSAVGKFIENLEDSGLTTEKDVSEVNDEVVIDDDVLLDQEIVPEDNELVVHAQAVQDVPAADLSPEIAPTKVPKENLEVESPPVDKTDLTLDEVKSVPDIITKNDFDALIDSAFSNLTVADVVKKLEEVNNIFRNREISRQLAIVDVMLDHLGLAPYFPTLSEAANKTLESNQYCLSRIDDIISKLRGTMGIKEISLTNENQKLSPEAKAVKSVLEQEEQKDKQRKDIKKQLQDKADLEKVTKPVAAVENAPQELTNKPVAVEQPVAKAV